MKNIVFILLAVALLVGCSKDENNLSQEQQLALDTQIIDNYIKDNNLIAKADSSGLQYFISVPGFGDFPTINDTVKVKYTGYLTNKHVFDKTVGNEVANFPLKKLIPGWREGVPLLKKGGKGIFFIPSYLGYGSQPPTTDIPKNAVLIFEIELVDF